MRRGLQLLVRSRCSFSSQPSRHVPVYVQSGYDDDRVMLQGSTGSRIATGTSEQTAHRAVVCGGEGGRGHARGGGRILLECARASRGLSRSLYWSRSSLLSSSCSPVRQSGSHLKSRCRSLFSPPLRFVQSRTDAHASLVDARRVGLRGPALLESR